MNRDYRRGWYFVSPEAISRYLFSVIRGWGYPVFWNTSDDSESCYLKINLGTIEDPRAKIIRISDHSVPLINKWIKFDVDLYCGHERVGATSYIKFLTNLSSELSRPMPVSLRRVNTETALYKKYRIAMQQRAKGNNRSYTGDRLYV